MAEQDATPRMKLLVRGRKDGTFSIALTEAPLKLAQSVVAQITEAAGAPPRSAPSGIIAVFSGELMECSYFMDAPQVGEAR